MTKKRGFVFSLSFSLRRKSCRLQTSDGRRVGKNQGREEEKGPGLFFYSPNGTLIGWEQTFRGLYYKTFLWVYLIPYLNKLKCWVWVN